MLALLWLFSIWSKLERWKISISGYFMSWLKILKNHFEVSSSLILSMQWGRIISPSDYDVRWKGDFIRQLVTTSSVVGLRRSSKALPKAKLAPKKGHGHCLVVCCPFDPLQISESQQNHNIWEVCSANWCGALKTAMPAANMGQQRGPMLLMTTPGRMAHNQRFKSWMNWATTFCLIRYIHLTSHQPTTSSSTSWHLFAKKTLPQPTACRKCFPRVHQIPRYGFLCYRNKQIYFLLAKMWWL